MTFNRSCQLLSSASDVVSKLAPPIRNVWLNSPFSVRMTCAETWAVYGMCLAVGDSRRAATDRARAGMAAPLAGRGKCAAYPPDLPFRGHWEGRAPVDPNGRRPR